MHASHKSRLYGSLVWIFSALVIFLYIGLDLLGYQLPGVEELVLFLSEVEGKYIYLAAFLSIFLEGLYFVGSFFPGSTLVVLIAVLSQIGGPLTFVTTILFVFLGWCLSGIINILFARLFRLTVARTSKEVSFEVKDRFLTTWFPAFRANYEVAQVSEGGAPLKVFLSSVRVKFVASLVAALYTLTIPLFVDIKEVSNEEGFITLAGVAFITLVVGIIKLKEAFSAGRS